MQKAFFSSLFIWLNCLVSTAQTYPQDYFSSPLDIPLILSGTFGELRSNHFHAGIDIKTQGREGLNVKAAANGQVVRIAVSPYGYGNALYVRHPNGYTTVYAHLKEFSPEIARWVKEQQYSRESFYVNLFPNDGQFNVSKGEVIAQSGNSGGSGGPHLHFEIRDSRTEEPINPLLFGYNIADARNPEVRGVYVYPLNGHLNGRNTRTSINLTNPRSGVYQFRWTQRAAGELGFAIDVIDRLDGAWNANGPFKIEQFVNGIKTNEFRAERFSFDETRYLNAHIDYDLYDCCQTRANRMWQLPGNALRMYRDQSNRGIVEILADSSYHLEWKISDAAGNITTLTGDIRYEAQESAGVSEPHPHLHVPHNSNFSTNVRDMKVNMPANILYESQEVDTAVHNGISSGYGHVYQFGRSGIPIHKHFEVALPLRDVPVQYHAKAVIVSLEDDLNESDCWDGSTFINHNEAYIKADVRTMGHFTIMLDTIAPRLSVISGVRNGSSLSTGNSIRLRVSDDLSGIQSYNAYIDNDWHLMSYDAKNNLLEIELDDWIASGNHQLNVKVVDDRNNVSELSIPFSYSLR